MEKIEILNKIFTKIENIISRPKLNIVKTIYFNFRTMPFKDAIKLPVFIYGKVQIVNLSGNVVFQNCKVKRGMVKLGKCVDFFYPKGRSLIMIGNKAKWIFKGTCFLNTRFTVRITENAILVLGDKVCIGSNVRICCQEKVCIGANTWITYNCEIIDSNFHYILNVENNSILRYTEPINIGPSNWIGNNSQIMKGTNTKENTMVAARSLLNRNYVEMYPDTSFITLAGIPAKLKRTGFQRISSEETILMLDDYFRIHSFERSVSMNAIK